VLYLLLASLITTWGVGRWVPNVVRHYGVTYFDWASTRKRRPLFRMLSVMAALLIVRALTYTSSPEVAPCMALMVVAMAGVLAADTRFQVIPDRFQIAGALGAFGFAYFHATQPETQLVLHVGTAVIVGGLLLLMNWLYEKLRGQLALGLGDIKMIAWLALAFGPDVLLVLTYSLLVALVVMLPLLLFRVRRMASVFAFGPFLVIGAAARFAEHGILLWS
jgi:prepilin signal peptidase PulO-like enzyme (type II secretory pathway)